MTKLKKHKYNGIDELNGYDFLRGIPPDALRSPESRLKITKDNPLAFALIYLTEHLKDSDGKIRLSVFHQDLVEYGKEWINGLGKPQEHRDAFIAPRGSGKSTWLFLILPMWAAAHGHVKFVAAYSSTAKQAENHLRSFKRELEQNELLKSDFPDLCGLEKASRNNSRADNSFLTARANGFVFFANGVDNTTHGLKYGSMRPDVLILDDIEPGESNYTIYQRDQRLATILDDIAPQNIAARMVFVGTTTMPESIIDQMRKYAELKGLQPYGRGGYEHPEDVPESLEWIKQQNIRVHYYSAILTDDEGEEYSLWPSKWDINWLVDHRHQRDFAKNFLNRPLSMKAAYWHDSDIQIGEEKEYGNTILSIDPAVTTKRKSDYTGLAVISRGDNAIFVRHAEQVKLSGEGLAQRAQELVDQYGCGLVYVETNQGGDLWRDVFKDVTAKFRAVKNYEKKEIRAGKVLNYYQRGLVYHTDEFPVLMEQMLSFPDVAHDDVLDAVATGVLYFLRNPRSSVKAQQFTYQGV